MLLSCSSQRMAKFEYLHKQLPHSRAPHSPPHFYASEYEKEEEDNNNVIYTNEKKNI